MDEKFVFLPGKAEGRWRFRGLWQEDGDLLFIQSSSIVDGKMVEISDESSCAQQTRGIRAVLEVRSTFNTS